MSEAPVEGGNQAGDTPAGEFKAITSQDELNAAIKDRLARERAKFSDYDELRSKATRLDEIEQANKTEVEKAQSKIADLEAELEKVNKETLRRRIANDHGITDADDIDLFLTGTDEETLTRQAQRLADRDADRKKHGNHVPREGATPQPHENELRSFARNLFQSGD